MKIDIKFLLLTIFIGALCILIGGKTFSIYLMIMAFLFIFSLLEIILLKRAIKLKLISPNENVNVGEKLNFKVEYMNTTYFSVDEAEITVDKISQKRLINIKAKDVGYLNYEFQTKVRGEFNLGEVVIKYRDFFNIFTVTLKDSFKKVKVYPKIDKYKFDKSIDVELGEGKFYKVFNNENQYVIKEMRRYVPGDNLKRINWRVSAKQNDLFIRNGEQTEEKELNIIFDMNEEILLKDEEGIFENALITDGLNLSRTLLEKKIKHNIIVNHDNKYKFSVLTIHDFWKVVEEMLFIKADSKKNLLDYATENKLALSENGTHFFVTIFNDTNYRALLSIKKPQNEVFVFTPKNDYNAFKENKSTLKIVEMGGVNYDLQERRK